MIDKRFFILYLIFLSKSIDFLHWMITDFLSPFLRETV